MDESNKTSQPLASECSSSHPRPFFYVQPAMQPFHAYQWHMNHPYSQHGFPGSAFHFGRPYMFPYSYLQYPGYMMPHTAMHPVDYRRIHDRTFPHAPGCDASFRQHQHSQATQRETTCVGAQTDPSEALNKLLECFDQLRACDSSQTSGSLSPLSKEPKSEEEVGSMEMKLNSKCNMADEDGDMSCSHVDDATQEEGCSLASGKEDQVQTDPVSRDSSESPTDSLSGGCEDKNQDKRVQDDVVQNTEEIECDGCITSQPSFHSSPASSSLPKKAEDQSLIQKQQDISCCILHLPLEKVLTSDVYGTSINTPHLGSALNYTYNPPQLTHERVSVLSPSLDELSSHDELLSTDLDEIDLFPTPIYTRGKLAGMTSRRSDLCLLYPKRLTCMACGSHTFKELSRTETCQYEDAEDSDELEGEHCLPKTVGKFHPSRKTSALLKHKLGVMHHREKAERWHECCKACTCSTEKSARVANLRPDRQSRQADQLLRDSVGVTSRAKVCRAQPLPQRPQRMGQRKARFKSPVCQSTRIEDDEDEEEVLHYHRPKAEAMVVTASHIPPGVETHAQNIPSGMTSMQGSRHIGPCSYRGSNPNPLERQQQGNWPFFYVQPSQPYVPCQWPVTMPYVPYGGYPGLGYGMVLPPFPPAPYVETPGYILPHTPLHVVDYRRMVAPHLAPTMAYQARRFRFQHTLPSSRVMVSSEVQTEPVCADHSQQGHNVVTSTRSSTESGSITSNGILSSLRPNDDRMAVPENGCKLDGEVSRIAAVQNGGILFQAEEVRIECSRSPSAVKIIHSKETTELASNADGELLQCNMGSAEDVVLSCFQPVSFVDEERKNTEDLGHIEEPCPDILMVSCPSNGSVNSLEGSIVSPVEPVNSTLVVQGDPSLVKNAQDIFGNPKSLHCKILRLPLDLQCLDDFRQMEASVWSVESLMPYTPTSEWMMQNSMMTSGKPSVATVMEVPAVCSLQSNQAPEAATPSLLDAGVLLELDGQEAMISQETLPQLLSSASRLAYFNAHEPFSNVQKIGNSGNWLKGQPESHDDKVHSGHQSSDPAPTNLQSSQSVMISGVSLPDQKCCSDYLFKDPLPKCKVCMCKICSVKCNMDVCSKNPSSKAGCMKRRRVCHAHVTGDKVIRLCALCKRDPEKKAKCKVTTNKANMKLSITNNEVSEVSENEYPSKSTKLTNIQNSLSRKHLETCPMSHQSKLKEQNCSCEDLKVSNSTSEWNNDHSTHNDLIWERKHRALSAAERWKDTEQCFTDEKAWRGSTQVSDSESTKSVGKTKTHKQKHCSQSQEVHRRDTRY